MPGQRFLVNLPYSSVRIAGVVGAQIVNGACAVILNSTEFPFFIERILVGLQTFSANYHYVVSLLRVNTVSSYYSTLSLNIVRSNSDDFSTRFLSGTMYQAPISIDAFPKNMTKYAVSNGRGFQWVAASRKDFIEFTWDNFWDGKDRMIGILIQFPEDEVNYLYGIDDANNPRVIIDITGETA